MHHRAQYLFAGSFALCAALSCTAAPAAKDGVKSTPAIAVTNNAALETPPVVDQSPAANMPPAANLVAPQASGAGGRSDAAAVTGGAPSPSVATDVQDDKTAARSKSKFAVRGRLDDGRYLGYHHHADEIRIGNPVQAETDRLHRSSPQAPVK